MIVRGQSVRRVSVTPSAVDIRTAAEVARVSTVDAIAVDRLREVLPDFDAYIMVDWSASSPPKRGADSVWWSFGEWRADVLASIPPRNPRTRRAAVQAIRQLLVQLAGEGKSVLLGFDFPFGYPAGLGYALGLVAPRWRALWKALGARIEDDQDKQSNNRFDVAADLNRAIGATEGPFWGHPQDREFDGLRPTSPAYPVAELARLRIAEVAAPGAQPAWKLWGNGSVGSQALLGIPYLEALRNDDDLASIVHVWPFETGCELPNRTDDPRIVLAEIYPSLVPLPADLGGRVKDCVQVEALVRHFACHDAARGLGELFAAPGRLPLERQQSVIDEEGWILGVLPN